MLPSALVITNGSPTGRQPWETMAATSISGPSTAPTAPSVTSWSSTTRRLPPGAMGGGDEQHGQVGWTVVPTEGIEHLADHLARRLSRHRVLGEPGGERHRH